MDYSNAAAAAVLQSIGTPETEATDSSAIAALESALHQNRVPVPHALHNSLTVANNKRNGTEVSNVSNLDFPFSAAQHQNCRPLTLSKLQVTRLLVDAVTVSTANSEREHCFLPSHKGSPYHVHKLAERILPAELLQVFPHSIKLANLVQHACSHAFLANSRSIMLTCIRLTLCMVPMPADSVLWLHRVQSLTMMLWQSGLSERRAIWARPALASKIGAYSCLQILGIPEQIRSYRCRRRQPCLLLHYWLLNCFFACLLYVWGQQLLVEAALRI